jgi:glucan endo-1,3-alpha-glucosidase
LHGHTRLRSQSLFVHPTDHHRPLYGTCAPWFFTHLPTSTDDPTLGKNWLFYSEDLFHYRGEEMLTLKPAMIEIVTWNDYGECHYIGPVNRKYPLDNDGSQVYADTDMLHVASRALAKLYIAAYKAGMTSADASIIKEDQVMYWYRTAPKGAIASSDPLGPPQGSDLVNDAVFVVTALTKPAQLKVTSGSTVTTAGVGASVAIMWATWVRARSHLN